MGNYCARSEHDDRETKPKFSIGKDYQEIEGQFTGEGIKKTLAWKATISRLQLDSKREEFWNTRTTGRRNVWMVIKSAVEADHETASLLLQMSGVALKGENITLLEDTNGNLYEIPLFIVNDPVSFSNEHKKSVQKQQIIENLTINVKIRKPGVSDDQVFQVNNCLTGEELRKMYAEKEAVSCESLRLFFSGREMKYENNLASHLIQNDMVVTAVFRSLEPLPE
jgi:hypothetical protein